MEQNGLELNPAAACIYLCGKLYNHLDWIPPPPNGLLCGPALGGRVTYW